MKNKLKKSLACLLVPVMSIFLGTGLIGCTQNNNDINSQNGLPTYAAKPIVITETKVDDEIIGGVLDLGIYNSFDEESALNKLKTKYGSNIISKAGCTCVVKDRSEQDEGLLIGRNMDFSLSNKPLYKYQLNINKYKAMGITYSSLSGEDYENAKKGTSVEANIEFFKFLPLIGTDFLNEKGLYIETDMRNLDYGTNPYSNFKSSEYGCTGTNPGKTDVCLMSVPCYVSTRCATVPEVLDLMRNEINIYNPTTTEEQFAQNGLGIDWNYCFVVADKIGNYGLIEVAKNQIFYTPKVGQTNFYRNDVLASVEDFPTGGWSSKTPGAPADGNNTLSCEEYENGGYGAYLDGKKSRYSVATENLANITTVTDMYENMRKVLYSQAYANQEMEINASINKYFTSSFNPRYEMVQCFPLVIDNDSSITNEADKWKLDFTNGNVYQCTFKVLTEMSESKFNELFKQYIEYHYTGKNKTTLLSEGQDYWLTSHSVITDIDNISWTCSFFEGSKIFEFKIK